ncbi:respiratory chain complex I subunit 1 family protein [Methanobacterium alcaliphilum]|uniref:respiratory chain complex I subunit 1 family protein n=1 Tax=Methanobacterium alcaliphilum TaxID=392018 RepID=UPI00200A804F|nr:NADH-quinone oxidoreductase subunit H [Methanobacterium alcaliphilum]MCK9151453.1 NADH-quinone oxidoreductase subunit H [Methanobacterium alcaliphilum]
MEASTIIYSTAAVIGTIIVAFIVSVWLPGIERKFVHARIQQRIGPPISSPGFMAPLKFFFKETIVPNSPLPRLYNALPLFALASIFFILLFLTPQMYFLGALTSVIAIVGLLKVEEVIYVFMGSLSRSVMSMDMPFPDVVKGAKHQGLSRSFLEDLSSMRAFRLIAFGSFPLYLAIFVPVAMAGSIFLGDIVAYQQTHGPVLFSVAGIIGAIVFFIGYMILLNEYPFAILKTKADVIEGPYMEYAAKYRAYNYITRGFLMFTLGALFSVLFLGIPPNIFSIGILVNIAVALIFPIFMAVMSAFSPIFTYKQFYPVVAGVSLLGILAIIAAFI